MQMDEETDSLAQPDAAQTSPASEDSSLEEILAQFEAEVPPQTRPTYEPDQVSYDEHARELNRSSQLSADLEKARKQLMGKWSPISKRRKRLPLL